MRLSKTKKISIRTSLLLFTAMFAILLIPIFAVVTHSAKAAGLNATSGNFYISSQDSSQGYIQDQNGRQGDFKTTLYKDPDDTNYYFSITQSGQVKVYYEGGAYSVPRFNSESGEQANSSNIAKNNNNSIGRRNDYFQVEDGENTLTPIGLPGYKFDHWVFAQDDQIGNTPEIGKTYRWVDGANSLVAVFAKCALLHGYVIDGGANNINSGQPISNAIVEFYNNTFYTKTRTNIEGYFELSADAIHGGVLEITYPNYRSYIKQLDPSVISPDTDMGKLNLYSVLNSINLSGKIYQEIDGIDYGVGDAYIYFTPEGGTKDSIYTKSNATGAAQKLNDNEEGTYSMMIDEGLAGTLHVYKTLGDTAAEATVQIDASETDIENFDVELEFSGDVKIITFSAPEGGTINVSNAINGSIKEASFVTSNYKVGNKISTDWNTGAVTIEDASGVLTTYTPQPKEGFAYYDWAIRNFDDVLIPLTWEDEVNEDHRHYTAIFRPAGKYIASSADVHHKEFKCTHTSQEFLDKVNFHKGATLEEELYAGTEITLREGKLVCRYVDAAETTYWKQDEIEAIGQEGYTVDKYYINGAEFKEGEVKTVAQNETVEISATYPTESANPQTGDYMMFIGLALGIIAIATGVYVIRKRREN